MNRVFRIVWSTALHGWVVASELAGKHGKGRGRAAATEVDERSSTSRSSLTVRMGVLMALSALYAAPSLAADRYWDVNGGSAGSGGTGTWDTTSPLWNSAADGVAGPFVTWNSGAPDNAIFAGTAGTVALGQAITAQNLTFNVANYLVSGNTLTLAGTTPTIFTLTGTTTISSILAGNVGLVKTGAGGLALSGTNTFTGGVNVLAGTLGVASDASLGAASNSVTMASGTSLSVTGTLAATRQVILGGAVTLAGAGSGAADFTGAGSIVALNGVKMSNANSNYTGTTTFGNGGGTYNFTSVADAGMASALGAPTAANETITVLAGNSSGGTLVYSGSGSSSNRDWVFSNTAVGKTLLINDGTGSLILTGNITGLGSAGTDMDFLAQTADMQLLGVLSTATTRTVTFAGTSTANTITLGGANTYNGPTTLAAATVVADVLANTGTSSSFGTGSQLNINLSTLSYTGGSASTDRTMSIQGASAIDNDGSGALAFTGAATFATGATNVLTLGGRSAGANTLAGALSGTGSVVMNGTGSWELDGANTYKGTTTVQGGTLIAGTDQAFGNTTALVVNGGTLDLNNQSITAPSLAGTGGAVNLGSGTLTLNTASGSTSYAGTIGGTGGLTKLGASTLTLTGANTYTGATTVRGGTLALDFSASGAPTSNIISGSSALNLGGGTLSIKGGTAANTQAFNGLNITAGNNRISATAGAGGMDISLGAINRSGGLIDFGFNAGATISTTNANGALGGWATVNGTDYAQVTGGVITAFTNYANKDDASQWLSGDFVSDAGGNANTPYSGTVNGTVLLNGLKYTANATSTVTVGAGNTLGVDGTIIITPATGSASQTIQGGSLSGSPTGGALGVLQNGGGNFTINSTIADNGVPTSFTVGGAGTGVVRLFGANTYTGVTTLSGSTLVFSTVANGGTASSLGASSADASNLVLENGLFHYTGATASTDRGFTLVNGGPARTIQVDAGTDLTFNGAVTSPDDAGFTKTGAGTLTLSGASNDFVGPVTVSLGTLAVNTLANGGLPSGIGAGASDPSNLVLQGTGALEYTGVTDTTDRGFTLGAGNGEVDVDNAATTLTDSGIVTGTGGLLKGGLGTLVLSGANNYTGGTTVNAGTLRAGSATAFGGAAGGAAGRMTVASGATLDLNGFSILAAGLNGAGNVTLGAGTLQLNGTTGTFTGAISGTGGVTVQAGSNQIMSGCGSSYTGPTTINGQLTIDCLANGGQNSSIGASSSAPANLAFDNGTLIYTGATVSTDRGIDLVDNAGISIANAATTVTVGGSLIDAGTLVKEGAGTLMLTGANNPYTGGNTVTAGTLRAGATNAFGSGVLTVQNVAGATADLNGFDNSLHALAGGGTTGGTVSLGGATLSINTGAQALGNGTFSGTITGTGNFVKNGSLVEYLAGAASTYVGVTTVNVGTLAVGYLADGGAASSIGSSSNSAANLVLNGGVLEYLGSGSSTDRLFSLGASTTSRLDADGSGAVQFTNTGAINFLAPNTTQTVQVIGSSTANNSLAAQITDNGTGKTSLSKSGTGTWILRNAASTYTGVTNISGGVLGVDHLTNGSLASSIGASSNAAANLVIGNGATLRYTGAGDTTDRLFTLSAGSSVIESSGTGAIVFSNTGSAAYSGSGSRTLDLGGTNTGNNTMGGTIIDGSGGVTTLAKNDAGTWLLTGTNTYTGNTVINGGILQLGNGGTSGSITSANVIIAAGTLAFDRSDTSTVSGTISGAGNVWQNGTGTTVLTSANTYSGGTSHGRHAAAGQWRGERLHHGRRV